MKARTVQQGAALCVFDDDDGYRAPQAKKAVDEDIPEVDDPWVDFLLDVLASHDEKGCTIGQVYAALPGVDSARLAYVLERLCREQRVKRIMVQNHPDRWRCGKYERHRVDEAKPVSIEAVRVAKAGSVTPTIERLIRQGMTNDEIAIRLGIGSTMVKKTRRAMQAKPQPVTEPPRKTRATTPSEMRLSDPWFGGVSSQRWGR